jgi:mRNA interferase RelE/StbE
VIYKVTSEEILVVIVAVGIRKDGAKNDIYNLAKKLFRVGLLEN